MTRIGVVGVGSVPAGKLPGVAYDRIDCGDGISSWAGNVATLLSADDGRGIVPLAIYNPRPFALDAAKFTALCETLKALNLHYLEFGNEVYYAGMTAAQYAALYAKALPIASEHVINLIFCCTGDYYDGEQWSQVEAGKGWLVDAVNILGHPPTLIALHPYEREQDNGVPGGGNPVGLPSVLRLQHWHKKAFGLRTPPVWITEYGVKGNGAEQAEAAADLVLLAAAVPFIAAAYWFAVADGAEGEYGLLTASLQPKPSAAAFTGALALI